MNVTRAVAIVFAVLGLAPYGAKASDVPLSSTLPRMPVKEVTVFKDGHAFVLHEGSMPTDAKGRVVLDYLPKPVMGTFWPYSVDRVAKLKAVTVGQCKVTGLRTAVGLRELLEANQGARVIVTEQTGPPYEATVVSVPTHTTTPAPIAGVARRTAPLITRPSVGTTAVLLKTDAGVKVVRLNRILDITFKESYSPTLKQEWNKDLMTLKLDWGDDAPRPSANVGMVYLQKGLRWIPSYRLTIDGEGEATVELQATLINELTDLDDVTAHFVVGVPSFAFKDTLDPMALQATAVRLSQYFRQDARTPYAFSNAIMSQRARMGEYRQRGAALAEAAGVGPELEGSTKNEDLFIWTVDHLTLKKGERLVMPIAKYSLPYEDVYTLDIDFIPPPEIRRQFNNQQQAQLARLFLAPKVMHKLRLQNSGDYPLTTAPVLIIRDGRVLAQGMMTYTAVGADSELTITTAVDVRVEKTDREVKREPNAVNWQRNDYMRINLAGEIKLRNLRSDAIQIEVTRNVLGNIDSASHDGAIEMVNVFEDRELDGGRFPFWQRHYSWPSWWHHFNGVGRIRWKIALEPSESTVLSYTAHYFWR